MLKGFCTGDNAIDSVAEPDYLLDPFRRSTIDQLGVPGSRASKAFARHNWKHAQLQTLQSTLRSVFSTSNAVMDLRIRHGEEYLTDADSVMLGYFQGRYDIDFALNLLVKRWSARTATLGLSEQRALYRAGLLLKPLKSEVICGPGNFRNYSRQCEPCKPGTYTDLMGQVVCRTCQPGFYVEETGAKECVKCPLGSTSKAGESACMLDVMSIAFFIFCVALFFTAFLELFLIQSIRITDLSTQAQRVVVTTFGCHTFHHWVGTSTKVWLAETGREPLDKATAPFRARVIDRERLELLGISPEEAAWMETSQGILCRSCWDELVNTGDYIPLVLHACLCIMGPIIAEVLMLSQAIQLTTMSEAPILFLFWSISIALVFALLVAVRKKLIRKRMDTPLSATLKDFRATLLEQSPEPTGCQRGEGRAVPAGKIVLLYDTFHSFIQARNAYFLDSNITKPLTQPFQLSFAELAGPLTLDYFLSHYWGMKFMNFTKTVEKHAKLVGKDDWQTTGYWVCFLSNNQWRVAEEVGVDTMDSSFFLALRSGKCKATCMVLDAQALPLTRLWCIFEVMQTYLLQHDDPNFKGLVFCTSGGVLGEETGCSDVAVALAQRLTGLNLEDAHCTVESDREMIRRTVEDEGGFDYMDSFVRCNMLHTLRHVKRKVEADFEVLSDVLSSAITAPVSITHSRPLDLPAADQVAKAEDHHIDAAKAEDDTHVVSLVRTDALVPEIPI